MTIMRSIHLRKEYYFRNTILLRSSLYKIDCFGKENLPFLIPSLICNLIMFPESEISHLEMTAHHAKQINQP